MVLIQLLLPMLPGGGSTEAKTPLAQTREELTTRFQGLTAYVRSPAKGQWTAPDGREENDDVVMIEVVTAVFDRAWWREYAVRLAERFNQDAIHIRALPMQLLDDET